MVTINQLAEMVMGIAGKDLSLRHIAGPLGVRGRNSDNRLIDAKLGWYPSNPLIKGMKETYKWVKEQVLIDKTMSAEQHHFPRVIAA
jgi:nucleoside-diphosphate-sugar epimerase